MARKPRGDQLTVEQLDAYEAHKQNARRRIAELSAAGRDIGEIPPVLNPARRLATSQSLRLHCLTYHPRTFCLPFSQDHLKAIEKIERVVKQRGGFFPYAMPRGSGKTSLAEVAAEWATLHAILRFVVLIGADADHATQMLDSIKTELESNDLLLEDFPEVCYPIRCLEGIAHRCKGQTHANERTRIEWSADRVVYPCIAGSGASGSCIRVAGITGRIRGMKHKLPTGESIRPDLVIPDDPQTDEAAASVAQVAKLERILNNAIMKLAGPGKKVAGVMPCTVIRKGDMADRALDHALHPDWQGERAKMLYSFPTDMKVWDEYRQLRAESLHRGGRGEEATAFYALNRAKMDAGAVVGWEHRYNPDEELSALQHALNLWMDDEESFYAEYQNEPRDPKLNDKEQLTSGRLCDLFNGRERGLLNVEVTTLTASIDVQNDLLYWTVCAFEPDFQGSVVDYGVWPEQARSYFTLRDANPTLRGKTGIGQLEGAWRAGLDRLVGYLLGKEWKMESGATATVSRVLIDANYGKATETIYRFARESQWSNRITPSHGKGITADARPLTWWDEKPGEKRGLHWVMPAPKPGRAKHVLFDTNFWKSFVHDRFLIADGARGNFRLFGNKPTMHRMFADQICAESREETFGRGRKVDVWKILPHKPDNHWLDTTVGCFVAAAMEGIALKDAAVQPGGIKVRKVSFSEKYRQAQERKNARRN